MNHDKLPDSLNVNSFHCWGANFSARQNTSGTSGPHKLCEKGEGFSGGRGVRILGKSIWLANSWRETIEYATDSQS